MLSVVIGLILASAFSAIVVIAQELVPGRVGTVSGVFFGFAFGAGGLGAALLGQLADATSIEFVYKVCVVPAGHRPADRAAALARAGQTPHCRHRTHTRTIAAPNQRHGDTEARRGDRRTRGFTLRGGWP